VAAAPYLSLIVPVVNGEAFIADNVRSILRTLETLGQPFEVIVVCDGSMDGTAARADVGDPRVQVIHYEENRGKGYAICTGIAASSGRLVGWLDSDLDISPTAILRGVAALQVGGDAAVGSKRHPQSRVSYPLQRRILSLGFQLLVRILLRVNVRDTQVGAKVFRREMLDTVAPLLLIKRYAFDLEVLAVGAEFGFDRVVEIPVDLDYQFTGTGINSSTVRAMFIDSLAISYRVRIRHWYVRQYAHLQRERMDAAQGRPLPAPDPPAAASEHAAAAQDLPVPAPDPPTPIQRAGGISAARR
jgi:glycosyltransferase involved in cell wall biosynthesis